MSSMAATLTRPRPTKEIIAALCGGDNYLSNSLHHGVYELPLNNFYPLLDLEELAAFAAGSWVMRDREDLLLRAALTPPAPRHNGAS